MVGWHITVYRQRDGGRHPASPDAVAGERLSLWQADVHFLQWIRDLTREGKALDLGGDGYPNRYTAQAKILLPLVMTDPPKLRNYGLRETDATAAAQCDPEEWLLIVAWDES